MRQAAHALAVAALLLAGCAQTGAPTATSGAASAVAAAAAKQDAAKKDAAVTASLAQFSAEEGRKVTAADVKLNDGRGAAELRVRLNAADKALLVQLYRLHPHAVEPSTFPKGLVERTTRHLATLHHFKLASQPELSPARVQTEMRTRTYTDGEGTVLAYESWLVGDNYQLFGKYDLKGRILKIDLETWQ